MSTTTPEMGLTKPTENGDEGIWDDSLNDDLDLLDAHDHSPGKGVPVPTAGIGIDTDLTFAGYQATHLKAVAFTSQGSDVATTGAIWVKTSDGGLYWTDLGGTAWKIADATGINVSLVGGITGDYAASSASFYYDDADEVYRALVAAPLPNDWAALAAGDLYLYEHASGIANYVKLKSPGSLAASYTVTWPAAVPGSTSLVQMASTGVLTASNTVANAVTMQSTLGVTGLITATAGVTCAANQHVTVGGTGEIKHGNRTLQIFPIGHAQSDGWDMSSGYMVTNGTAGSLIVAIPLLKGDRIQSVTISRYGDGAADFTTSTGLYTSTPTTAGAAVAGATGSIVNPPASWADTTYTPTTPTALADGECAYLTLEGNAADLRVGTIRVVYDHP